MMIVMTMTMATTGMHCAGHCAGHKGCQASGDKSEGEDADDNGDSDTRMTRRTLCVRHCSKGGKSAALSWRAQQSPVVKDGRQTGSRVSPSHPRVASKEPRHGEAVLTQGLTC